MYGVEDKTGKERNERLKIKNERKDLLACLRWKRKCVVVVDLCACALRICLERYNNNIGAGGLDLSSSST